MVVGMDDAGRSVILGASSTLGGVLRTRLEPGRVVSTHRNRPVAGGVPFLLGHHRLVDLPGHLRAGDRVFLLAGATAPNWIHEHEAEAECQYLRPLLALIDEAEALGMSVTFFSSELVFDGVLGGYAEEDPISPTTVYGKHKVILERRLLEGTGKHLVVRTGALASRGCGENCLVEKTWRTLMGSGACFAEDARLSLTHVDDLVDATLGLLEGGHAGLFHISGPPIGRADLAELVRCNSRFSQRMPFRRVPFASIAYPEPRPKNSWLSTEKLENALRTDFRPAEVCVRRKVLLLEEGMGYPA